MRLVYGVFSIAYDGRGHSFREEAERLLIIKADTSIAIHNDKGYKPINYMMPPVEKTVSEDEWTFSSANEKIVLKFSRIYSDNDLRMEEDLVKVIKEGTEAHLQLWLSENLSLIEPSLEFLEREFETGEGPVDLLAARGETQVLIEVKRVAGGPAVAQINRYLKAYSETEKNISGAIIALDFNKKALELARKHGIECIVVPKEAYGFGVHTFLEGQSLLESLNC